MGKNFTCSELLSKRTSQRKYRKFLVLSCFRSQSQDHSTSAGPDSTANATDPKAKPYEWTPPNESEYLTDSSAETCKKTPFFCAQILSKIGFKQRSTKFNVSSTKIKDQVMRNQQNRKRIVTKRFTVSSCFTKKRIDLDPSPWFTERTSKKF